MIVFLSITDTNKQLEKKIADEASVYLNKLLKKKLPSIVEHTKNLIESALRNSNEVNSILSGELRYHIGVNNTGPIINAIISVIRNSITSRLDNVNLDKGLGGFTIKLLEGDFNNILNLPGTSYVSVNRRKGTSYLIDWLRWLLFRGQDTIIDDHRIKLFDTDVRFSRTGRALMVPKGTWGYPTQYTGTQQDNFITRAINTIDKEFEDFVQKELS